MPLVVLIVLVGATLAYIFWLLPQFARMSGAQPANPAQQRFAKLTVSSIILGGLILAAALVLIPLPIGAWGYVGIGAVMCTGFVGLAHWCNAHYLALAD